MGLVRENRIVKERFFECVKCRHVNGVGARAVVSPVPTVPTWPEIDFKTTKEFLRLGDALAVSKRHFFGFLIVFDLVDVEHPIIPRHGNEL